MANTYTDANKAYRRLTGLCGSEIDFFDNLAYSAIGKDEEARKQLYADTMFMVPDGRYLTGYMESGETYTAGYLKAQCVEAANAALGLNVSFDDPKVDIDNDGDVDETDAELKSTAKVIKAKKAAAAAAEEQDA